MEYLRPQPRSEIDRNTPPPFAAIMTRVPVCHTQWANVLEIIAGSGDKRRLQVLDHAPEVRMHGPLVCCPSTPSQPLQTPKQNNCARARAPPASQRPETCCCAAWLTRRKETFWQIREFARAVDAAHVGPNHTEGHVQRVSLFLGPCQEQRLLL